MFNDNAGSTVLCQDLVSTPGTQINSHFIQHYGNAKPYLQLMLASCMADYVMLWNELSGYLPSPL